MNIIYMLLAISLFVALVFFVLFIFSMKRGQYDDTYTPSVRMLFEDELVKEGAQSKNKLPKSSSSNYQKPLTNPDK